MRFLPRLFGGLGWLSVSLLSACGYVGLGLDDDLGLEDKRGSGGATDFGIGGGVEAGGEGGAPPDGSGGAPHTGGQENLGGAREPVPDFPCSVDCEQPYLLYRTFELGVPPDAWVSGGGVVTQVREPAHSGEHSLKLTQGAPGSEAEVAELTRKVSTGSLYFRAWYFIPEGAVNHWLKLAAFNGEDSAGVDIDALAGDALQIYSIGAFETAKSERAAYPTNEWFCLQVDLLLGEFNGSVNVRVNGETAVSLTGTDTLPATGIERIIYGIGVTGNMQYGASLFVDDVLASTEPIGCN